MADMFVELSDSEIRALYEWHKNNQWDSSGKEEYAEAEWHKNRSKQLLEILENKELKIAQAKMY
jgi:hypothetical protein